MSLWCCADSGGSFWKTKATTQIVELIPDNRIGRHVAGQLIRCGTSSAPNYDESCDAESRKDFVHKLSIAVKEMRESSGWLRFLIKMKLLTSDQVGMALDESLQLRRMLGSSLKTARSNPDQSWGVDEEDD